MARNCGIISYTTYFLKEGLPPPTAEVVRQRRLHKWLALVDCSCNKCHVWFMTMSVFWSYTMSCYMICCHIMLRSCRRVLWFTMPTSILPCPISRRWRQLHKQKQNYNSSMEQKEDRFGFKIHALPKNISLDQRWLVIVTSLFIEPYSLKRVVTDSPISRSAWPS